MLIAKKRQRVLNALAAVRDFIWIEDLYLLLRSKGEAISSRTVHDTVWELNRIGLICCQVEGRRTMVKLQSDEAYFF